MSQRTVIIGAGMGGLVLSRVLARRGVSSEIYEGEISVDVRGQGGSLDMHVESGQRALRECGLFERFQPLVHVGGDAMKIVNKANDVLLQRPGGGNRPEIAREQLRLMLLNEEPHKPIVHWGHKLTSIVKREQASPAPPEYELTFANGLTVTADLVVGADGAWSRVRAFVSPQVKPVDLGVLFVEFHVRPERMQPVHTETVGRGSLFALGANKALLTHAMGDGVVRVYATLRVDATWHTRVDWSNASTVRETLLREFADWATALSDLIRLSDDDAVPRQLYMLPLDSIAYAHVRGVTLLGDAAHVMSPFGGEGANHAMWVSVGCCCVSCGCVL
jgi:2-polyprenyl-6-methoxyphenol hydroxylase-like FAD-dependent oxidoreductase